MFPDLVISHKVYLHLVKYDMWIGGLYELFTPLLWIFSCDYFYCYSNISKIVRITKQRRLNTTLDKNVFEVGSLKLVIDMIMDVARKLTVTHTKGRLLRLQYTITLRSSKNRPLWLEKLR